ncbi:hypothetical protein FHS42_001354 [Streptomyces zagrosensis]|uniref:Uncharacterized protein n=1 Tax=Streptomyces zagrosensis TaxID=1042984 RepID=A0A7W9Q640_9ACTN|nr:hypothetical protein [Streptomyces zagrosensis]
MLVRPSLNDRSTNRITATAQPSLSDFTLRHEVGQGSLPLSLPLPHHRDQLWPPDSCFRSRYRTVFGAASRAGDKWPVKAVPRSGLYVIMKRERAPGWSAWLTWG